MLLLHQTAVFVDAAVLVHRHKLAASRFTSCKRKLAFARKAPVLPICNCNCPTCAPEAEWEVKYRAKPPPCTTPAPVVLPPIPPPPTQAPPVDPPPLAPLPKLPPVDWHNFPTLGPPPALPEPPASAAEKPAVADEGAAAGEADATADAKTEKAGEKKEPASLAQCYALLELEENAIPQECQCNCPICNWWATPPPSCTPVEPVGIPEPPKPKKKKDCNFKPADPLVPLKASETKPTPPAIPPMGAAVPLPKIGAEFAPALKL